MAFGGVQWRWGPNVNELWTRLTVNWTVVGLRHKRSVHMQCIRFASVTKPLKLSLIGCRLM